MAELMTWIMIHHDCNAGTSGLMVASVVKLARPSEVKARINAKMPATRMRNFTSLMRKTNTTPHAM